MSRTDKPNYGIDSPAIIAGQVVLGLLGLAWAIAKPGWIGFAVAAYFLLGAFGMLRYSLSGKFGLRETLLETIPWRGDEIVLDIGCGKGLLLAGAARRLTTGKAIGVDIWIPHAISGNRPEAVLRNLALEGVADRAELKRGDLRELPFEANTSDVIVSNFVVHEMNAAPDRERMLQEMVRVLKPGGRLALIDFIFTRECVDGLRAAGLDARRRRIGGPGSWVATVLTLGVFQLYLVTATKRAPAP